MASNMLTRVIPKNGFSIVLLLIFYFMAGRRSSFIYSPPPLLITRPNNKLSVP